MRKSVLCSSILILVLTIILSNYFFFAVRHVDSFPVYNSYSHLYQSFQSILVFLFSILFTVGIHGRDQDQAGRRHHAGRSLLLAVHPYANQRHYFNAGSPFRIWDISIITISLDTWSPYLPIWRDFLSPAPSGSSRNNGYLDLHLIATAAVRNHCRCF